MQTVIKKASRKDMCNLVRALMMQANCLIDAQNKVNNLHQECVEGTISFNLDHPLHENCQMLKATVIDLMWTICCVHTRERDLAYVHAVFDLLWTKSINLVPGHNYDLQNVRSVIWKARHDCDGNDVFTYHIAKNRAYKVFFKAAYAPV